MDGMNEQKLDQPAAPSDENSDENFRDWYRNDIWGVRQDDDDVLFEVMCLQVFQAGLTWRMVLARRDAFRRAFSGWRISEVAAMDDADVARMTADKSIIRNRQKIQACIANAQAVQGIQREHGSFCRWFYDGLDTTELGELQKWLRGRFKFMGPEIARMWLMASGRIPTVH